MLKSLFTLSPKHPRYTVSRDAFLIGFRSRKGPVLDLFIDFPPPLENATVHLGWFSSRAGAAAPEWGPDPSYRPSLGSRKDFFPLDGLCSITECLILSFFLMCIAAAHSSLGRKLDINH